MYSFFFVCQNCHICATATFSQTMRNSVNTHPISLIFGPPESPFPTATATTATVPLPLSPPQPHAHFPRLGQHRALGLGLARGLHNRHAHQTVLLVNTYEIHHDYRFFLLMAILSLIKDV
jgi:hypothetical protein